MCPVTRFFAVETILSFWGDLESFDKKVWPITHFFRSADYLKFLLGLGKFRQKKCAQSYVSSLWRLTWVFDGTWKNFHKKVCPVTRFFAVETILSFEGTWEVSTKRCDQLHIFFAVQTILCFWWDLKSFEKKVWPVTRFFAVQTNLSFWWDLEKFSQKSVPSHTFLRCGAYLKFLRGLGKFRQKGVTSYTFFSQCRLS